VLPDELEKHCTGAEPILDKNGLASKKAASAHLPLWICRRFSTDEAVLRAFGLLNLSVCIRFGIGSLPSFRQLGKQDAVVISSTGPGCSTFFLQTKNARAVLAWAIVFGVRASYCVPVAVRRKCLTFKTSVFHAKSLLCFS
jgi:hypothetical protein